MIILPTCVVVLAAGLVDRFHRVQKIARGAGQPIELPNDNDIARPDLVKHTLKFRPLPIKAGDLLAEDLLTSGFLQRLQRVEIDKLDYYE